MPQGDRLRWAARQWARLASFGSWFALAAAAGLQPWGPAAHAAAAPAAAVTPPSVSAPSAVLMDANSGRILVDRAGDQVRQPASMVKIMTLVLALKALNTGRVRATDLVSVSDEAYHTGGSQIWLEPGEVLPFGQLVTAVAVGSANDAAVALAEHLAGSAPAFVDEMNAMARRLGMSHTKFVNPNGLDAPGVPTQTTALDMARLGAYATHVPGLLQLTSTREDRNIRNGKGGKLWLVNTNRLLGQVPGVDGLKTGYTSEAGFCLTATAHRSGLRLVAVVMGAANSKARFADAASLLNWGFAHYKAVYAARAGESLAEVAVRGGRTSKVAVGPLHDAVFTVMSGEPSAFTRHTELPTTLSAPVKKGQVVGEILVKMGDKIERVPVVALADVARATPFDLLRRFAGLVPKGATPPPKSTPKAS